MSSAPAAEGGFFAVSGVARLALTGPDRVRYLNGQVSNNVPSLRPGAAIRACVLSVKGKLDGVVWIWTDGEKLNVEVDAGLNDSLQTRLEKYIVADDVAVIVEPVGKCLHVTGDAVERVPGSMVSRSIARLGAPGIDVEDPAAADELLSAGINELSAETVEYLRIKNRVPAWGAELGPDTLPAEAGLDRTAVDFHKGCYIGQEVVSRIESVGHANRSLRVFEVLDGPKPESGAEFFLPENANKPAAVVTSVSFALSPAIGLCYIKRGTPEDQVLECPSNGARIQIRPCVQPS